ncbi:MAG TPA: LysR substrate-binding domain-containing protein, partial [Dehalococcoidia bacterium]|nr:LysR substrate-binding domain-containing protein [Dehalococcoidia bacterium]
EAAKRAMQEGLGVSFLFRVSVEREIESGDLVELNFEGPRFWAAYNLISSPTRYHSPLVRRFQSFLRSEVAALFPG